MQTELADYLISPSVTSCQCFIFQAILGTKQCFHYPSYQKRLFPTFCNRLPGFCARVMSSVSGYNIPNLNMVSRILDLVTLNAL